ncbi:MAG: hypothetical protein WCA46_29780, partial [Actinocatenispora sp.]
MLALLVIAVVGIGAGGQARHRLVSPLGFDRMALRTFAIGFLALVALAPVLVTTLTRRQRRHADAVQGAGRAVAVVMSLIALGGIGVMALLVWLSSLFPEPDKKKALEGPGTSQHHDTIPLGDSMLVPLVLVGIALLCAVIVAVRLRPGRHRAAGGLDPEPD